MSAQQPENKGREIKVTVDNEQMKSMALDFAKEQLKNDKLLDMLARREVADDHSDLATKKLQVYQKFNDSNALNCQTVEDLKNFITQKINDASRQTPAGSAPLNAQQYGQSDDIYRRRFPDQKSMVDAILSDMHGSDLQKAEVARSYYNKMLELWVRSKRETQKYDENFFNPNLPQNMPSDLKRTPEGFLVSENEGDIKRITNSWRAERLRKMGKLNEQGEVVK